MLTLLGRIQGNGSRKLSGEPGREDPRKVDSSCVTSVACPVHGSRGGGTLLEGLRLCSRASDAGLLLIGYSQFCAPRGEYPEPLIEEEFIEEELLEFVCS